VVRIPNWEQSGRGKSNGGGSSRLARWLNSGMWGKKSGNHRASMINQMLGDQYRPRLGGKKKKKRAGTGPLALRGRNEKSPGNLWGKGKANLWVGPGRLKEWITKRAGHPKKLIWSLLNWQCHRGGKAVQVRPCRAIRREGRRKFLTCRWWRRGGERRKC